MKSCLWCWAALWMYLCRLSGPATLLEDAELARLQAMMTGWFTSAEQARSDPEYFEVHLQMVPIWTERAGEHWLYVEQALATALDKPYRQRVYRLERRADGRLVSRVYTLPGDPLAYAGAWKKPDIWRDLKPEQLTERTGCAIVLTRQADGSYAGSTQGTSCPSDLRGARYATSEVVITPDTLTSWDRGFDADGKQVWGAKKGPYVFKKQPPDATIPPERKE